MSGERAALRSRRRRSRSRGGGSDDDDDVDVGKKKSPPRRSPPPSSSSSLSRSPPPHIDHALSAVPAQLTAFSLARTSSEPTWFWRRGSGSGGGGGGGKTTATATTTTSPSFSTKSKKASSLSSQQLLHATLALLSWSAASAALVFMNKRLLVDSGFSYPLALTGAGQFVSAAAAAAASKSGLWGRGMTIGPLPRPLGQAARALAPPVLCSAATLYFGNAAYLSLSLTFIQMLKVLMPAFTLTAASAAGLETPTRRLVLSVLLILAGSAAATAAEAGMDFGSVWCSLWGRRGGGGGGAEKGRFLLSGLLSSSSLRSFLPGSSPTPPSPKTKKTFSWVGFSSFVLSTVFEAGRVVWMQALMASTPTSSSSSSSSDRDEKNNKKKKKTTAVIRKYNPAEVLTFLGPPTGLVLLVFSLLIERDGLLHGENGLRAVARSPFKFASALLMGFAVNATTAAAIGATSSLTFKVFGCAKNVVVVLLGIAAGDTVSTPAAIGYAISMVGFALYTAAKMGQEKRGEKEKEKNAAFVPSRRKKSAARARL